LVMGTLRSSLKCRPGCRAPPPRPEQYREVVVIVTVAVPDAAAVDNHAVVQHAAVGLFHGFQFGQEPGELGGMKEVDLRDFELFSSLFS